MVILLVWTVLLIKRREKLMYGCVLINFSLATLKLNFWFLRTRQKSDFKVNTNEFNVEQKERIKYLGVFLDDKLNWRAHLRSFKLKLSRSCFVLSKLRYYSDVIAFKIVYYSLFYPHIKYCISAWGGAAECYLKQNVSMQRRIVRYVCRVPLTPTNPLFLKLVGWN